MAKALAQKAIDWITGNGVPPPIAGLMQPINVKAAAAEMNLEGRGAERGAREVPATEDAEHDAIEREVIGRVMNEWTLQRGHLITMLRAYRDRLSELTAGVEIGKLRLEAANAITRFDQARYQFRGNLSHLRTEYTEALRELTTFKDTHGLSRPARKPGAVAMTYGLLFFCIAIESALNGFFFSQGSEYGLVGGIGTAIGISLVNVVFCFVLGILPARYTNHRRILPRLLGYLVTTAGLLGILGLHLVAAHFRETSATVDAERAFAAAVERVLGRPWALADINSWYLFGLGLLFGGLAFFKGYSQDDPYPGYGAVAARARKARTAYDEEGGSLFEDLEKVRDTTIEDFRTGMANIPQYAAKADQVRGARSALIGQFRAYELTLSQAANLLLTMYREANRRARTTEPPRHFRDQWALPSSALASADIVPLVAETEDAVVTNVDATLTELRELSEEVLKRYTELVRTVEHSGDMRSA